MVAHEERPKVSVVDLAERVNSAIAAKRRTLRVVETSRFGQAYSAACNTCREKVEALIEKDDQNGIERWIREQLQQEYSAMSIRELRTVGQQFGIPQYNRLPKASLLSEIIRYAEAAGRKGTEPSGQGDLGGS